MRIYLALFALGCSACEDPTMYAVEKPPEPEEPCVLQPHVVQSPAELSQHAYGREITTAQVAEIAGGCEDLLINSMDVTLHQVDHRSYKRMSICDVFECDGPINAWMVDGSALSFIPRDACALGKLGLHYRKDEDAGEYTIHARTSEVLSVGLIPRADAPQAVFVLMLEGLTLTHVSWGPTEQYQFAPVLGPQMHIEGPR